MKFKIGQQVNRTIIEHLNGDKRISYLPGKIVALRNVYGRQEYLIQPHKGEAQWVTEKSLQVG